MAKQKVSSYLLNINQVVSDTALSSQCTGIFTHVIVCPTIRMDRRLHPGETDIVLKKSSVLCLAALPWVIIDYNPTVTYIVKPHTEIPYIS